MALLNCIERNVVGIASILKSSVRMQNFAVGKSHKFLTVSICASGQRSLSSIPTRFLDIGSGRKIAYKFTEGNPNKPTVVYVPGLLNTMEETKAVAVDGFCKSAHVNFIRFDFEGIGESSGSPEKVYFGQWIEDLQNVVDKLCKKPVVLVGFSMGGWISTVVATQRPEKMHSILYVAPAFNFLESYFNIFYQKKLSPEQQKDYDDGKCVYYNDLFMRKDFVKESKKYDIDLENPIPINVPIRMIHGMQDRDAPYVVTMKLLSQLESVDVDLYLRKSGKHHLVEACDLALLTETLGHLIQDYPINRRF